MASSSAEHFQEAQLQQWYYEQQVQKPLKGATTAAAHGCLGGEAAVPWPSVACGESCNCQYFNLASGEQQEFGNFSIEAEYGCTWPTFTGGCWAEECGGADGSKHVVGAAVTLEEAEQEGVDEASQCQAMGIVLGGAQPLQGEGTLAPALLRRSWNTFVHAVALHEILVKWSLLSLDKYLVLLHLEEWGSLLGSLPPGSEDSSMALSMLMHVLTSIKSDRAGDDEACGICE